MQSPIATSKIAAVQAAPVYFDRDATIAKACDLIAVAGGEGARLIVFPEAFIPAYPGWVWHLAPAQAGGMLRLVCGVARSSGDDSQCRYRSVV
jgi:nitrilase